MPLPCRMDKQTGTSVPRALLNGKEKQTPDTCNKKDEAQMRCAKCRCQSQNIIL